MQLFWVIGVAPSHHPHENGHFPWNLYHPAMGFTPMTQRKPTETDRVGLGGPHDAPQVALLLQRFDGAARIPLPPGGGDLEISPANNGGTSWDFTLVKQYNKPSPKARRFLQTILKLLVDDWFNHMKGTYYGFFLSKLQLIFGSLLLLR